MASNDYYQVLRVSKTSSAEEIKKAYRKMALEYHPDRNKTKEAETKFKEVTKAYEVLSDPQKKQTYDQFGAAAFEQGGVGQGGGGPFGGGFGQQGGQYGPFTYTYSSSGNGNGADFDFGGFSDPFEIFEQFFGGAGFGQRAGARRSTYAMTIDFLEAVHGTEKQATIEGKTQKVKIPAGVDDGSRIRFDSYDVVVRVRPDDRFKREGYDIISENEILFTTATLGDIIDVETIDEVVKLRIPAGTQPDTVFRLRSKGVPHVRGSGKGDHYAKIKVIIPKHISAKQKEMLKQFDQDSQKKNWF